MADPRTARIEAWSVREADQAADLASRTEQAVWSLLVLWSLPRWFSDSDREAAAREAAALIEQSRQVAGNLGVAYMREVLSIITGRQVRPRTLGLPPARRGVDLTEVYARPVEAYRREFSVTGDAAQAQTAARARLRELIDADLMLARRDAELGALGIDVTALARAPREGSGTYALDLDADPVILDQDALADLEPQAGTAGPLVDTRGDAIEILGYRRLTHPERSETGVCGLCLAAADRIYTLAELLPIHGRCKCTVAPITSDYDPGESNLVDLERLYRAAGATVDKRQSTKGRDLKNVRYQVDEHGELGLVLSRAGDTFSRRGDAPKGDPIERARRELAALEPVLVDLEARAAAGDDVTAPLTYQRNRIAKLRDIVAGAAA